MAESTSFDLRELFTTHLVEGLVANNVLRGHWAEELVAHYLGDVDFADQWCFFDLAWRGFHVSVKHSTGPKARFGVRRSKDAWLPDPSEPGKGGWMAGGGGSPRCWCDLYVFAHLPGDVTLERVLDESLWQFAAMSRTDMEREFAVPSLSCSRSRLEAITEFVGGDGLLAAATSAMGG